MMHKLATLVAIGVLALVFVPSVNAEGVGYKTEQNGMTQLFAYCEPVSNQWFVAYRIDGTIQAGTYDSSNNFDPIGPKIPFDGVTYRYEGDC